MDDAHDPYEDETDARGENIQIENAKTKSNGRRNQMTPLDIVETMRSLSVELHSSKEDDERLLRDKEEQNQLNATMLQILTTFKGILTMGIIQNIKEIMAVA